MSSHRAGQCVIVGQKLTTFDGVTVRLPDQAVGCEALVAMDCNSEGNFTVKVASGDGFSWHFKKVIVQFPTNKFVIVKASQMMTIYNNGEDLGLLSPGQPIVIKEGCVRSARTHARTHAHSHARTRTRIPTHNHPVINSLLLTSFHYDRFCVKFPVQYWPVNYG